MGNPMCNSSTSVQPQDELTISLCHMEEAGLGSKQLFQCLNPFPLAGLSFLLGPKVFVARGAEFEGQQPASSCGIYLLPFHFPSAWVRLQ